MDTPRRPFHGESMIIDGLPLKYETPDGPITFRSYYAVARAAGA